MDIYLEINNNSAKFKKKLYFPRIDGLRFLAFFLVFIYHLNLKGPIISLFNHYGRLGMDLFFVISSFLLTKLIMKEIDMTGYISVRKFYVRRILRIWPLYFATILSFLFVLPLLKYLIGVSPMFVITKQSMALFLGFTTFTYDIWTAFLPFTQFFNKFIGHLWSISLEEKFYILLPLFLPFLLKLKKETLLKVGCGTIFMLMCMKIIPLLLSSASEAEKIIYYSPLHFEAFIIGLLLAVFDANIWFSKLNNYIKLLIGFTIFEAYYYMNIWAYEMKYAFFYILIALFCAVFLDIVNNAKSKVVDLIFANTIISYLGKISYGLYVFHLPVTRIYFIILKRYFPHFTYHYQPYYNIISVFICFAITVMFSILSYELYEKKFLKIKGKFTVVENRSI